MGSPIQISEADYQKAILSSKAPVEVSEADFPTTESGILNALKKGWRRSATAMLLDKTLQGRTAPEEPIEGLGNQVTASLATVLGDLPAFLTFGTLGAVAPPGAQFVTMPAAAMAGTELFKEGLRDLQPGETGLDALVRQLKGAGKGGVIGATMGPLGRISTLPGISPILQKAGLPLEVAGAATVGAGLEGRQVTPEDIALMAAPVAGVKAAVTIPKKLVKAVSTKAESERLEKQRISAEKAGIPSAAPQAFTTPEVVVPEIAGAIGAGEVGKQRRQREKAIAEIEAGQQIPLDLGTGEAVEWGKALMPEQGELFSATPIEEVQGDTQGGKRIQSTIREGEAAIEGGPESGAGETPAAAGGVLQASKRKRASTKKEGVDEVGAPLEKIIPKVEPMMPLEEQGYAWFRGDVRTIEKVNEDGSLLLQGFKTPIPSKRVTQIPITDFELHRAGFPMAEVRAMTPEERGAALSAVRTLSGDVRAAEQAATTIQQNTLAKTADKVSVDKHQQNLSLLADRGIEWVSRESNLRVSDLRPVEVQRLVDAIQGNTPVSAHHAEAKAALDRVMTRLEGYEKMLDEGEIDYEVDPAILDRMASDARLARKLGALSDEEFTEWVKKTGYTREPTDISTIAKETLEAQARITAMDDAQLDEYINSMKDVAKEPTLVEIRPTEVKPSAQSTPTAIAGEVGKARRVRNKKEPEHTPEEQRAIEQFAMEVAEHLDIETPDARKRVQEALKHTPKIDLEERLDIIRNALGMEEGERGVSNFIADVSAVIGGSDTTHTMFGGQIAYEGMVKRLIKGEGLSKKQEAARRRILRDWEKFSIDAAREGKTVYQYMLEQGVPVGYATPFMGPLDKKYRIEFSDDTSGWIKKGDRDKYTWEDMAVDKSYRLDEVYNHPDLYALYPFMRNIWIQKVIPRAPGWRGSLIGKHRIKISRALNEVEARKTLLHEIMHRIQHEEGFATGAAANLSDIVNYAPQLRTYFNNMIKQISENPKSSPSTLRIFKDKLDMLNQVERDPDMITRIDSLPEETQVGINGLARDAYWLHAGEAEARSVMKRADMPMNIRSMTKVKFGSVLPDEAIIKYSQTKSTLSESMDMRRVRSNVENFIKRARVRASGPTTQLVREVEGEQGAQSIYCSEKPNSAKDVWTKQGEWIRGPIYRYNGTIAEKPVFDLISADLAATHRTHQDYSVLRDAKKDLTEQEQKNVRKVLEGKITGNPKEQEAALTIRRWLDEKRIEYQDFLREQYRKHLKKEEVEVLDMLLSGEDILRVNALARKLDVDLDVMEDIAKEYRAIDKWGLDDYVTKVELGRWKVMAAEEEGKREQIVAVGMSKEDAARKAADWLLEHPNVKSVHLDNSFIAFSDSKTEVTPRQYRSMMNKLAKAIKEQDEELSSSIAKHLAKKAVSRNFIVKPNKVWSPFVQERRADLKGEENIFDVLPAYARSMNKKMNLDPILGDIRALSSKMPENIRDGVLELADAAKGKYFAEDKFVDNLLTRLGKPFDWEPRGRVLTRGVSRVKEIETKLKMGFRPIAATINFVTGQINAWAATGTNYYLKGIRMLFTPEGRRLIHEEAPYLGVNVLEDPSGQLKRESTSLRMYSWVELPNREVSIAANYLLAKEKYGMSDGAAREFARKANWMQQTLYTMAALPRALRGPSGRLIGQFKPWLLNQFEFFKALSPAGKARYSAAMLALTGPHGAILMLKTLPLLGLMGLWDDIDQWLNVEFPRTGRGLLGAATGADVTGSAVPQLPTRGEDWIGATLSDMSKLWSGIVKPIIEGEKLGWRDYRSVAESIVPVMKHWDRLIEQIVDKDGWVKDERGRRLYKIPDEKEMTAFIARSAAGAESIGIARERLSERIWQRKTEVLNKNKTHVIDNVLDTVMAGKPISEQQIVDLVKYGINTRSLLLAMTYRKLTPEQRLLLRTEIRRRPELVEAFPWAFSRE